MPSVWLGKPDAIWVAKYEAFWANEQAEAARVTLRRYIGTVDQFAVQEFDP